MSVGERLHHPSVPVPLPPIDHEAVCTAIEFEARRAATLLGSLPDTRLPIPVHGSTWTARETAAHMIAGARVYGGCLEGEASPVTDCTARWQVNAKKVAALPERSGSALADMLTEAVSDYLRLARTRRTDEIALFHEGQPTDIGAISAVLLGQQIGHGWDIARAPGRPWPIKPAHARLVIEGICRIMHRFVSAYAAGVTAAYAIHIRGGRSFTCRFVDGRLAVTPPDGRPVDCHILADPAAIMLVTYGRIGQWEPIMQGKLLAWERKPWLAFGFKKLFRNPQAATPNARWPLPIRVPQSHAINMVRSPSPAYGRGGWG